MKPLIFPLCVVIGLGGLGAQTPVWQPSLGNTQVPIWPGAVPDAQPVSGPENSGPDPSGKLIAGRTSVYIDNCRGPR